MIYLVHGSDTVKTRAIIVNQQKKLGVDNRIELNVHDMSLQELSSHILTQDIFGDSKFLVLDISSCNTKEVDQLAKVLENQSNSSHVIIVYSSKSHKPKDLETLTSMAFVKEVKFDSEVTANVFAFLDAVFTKSRKQTYRELEQLTTEGHDAFYIFSMLLYGLRNLFFAKDQSTAYQKMKPFQQSKVKKQASLYSVEDLKALHKNFYEYEVLAKSKGLKADLFLTFCIEKVLNS